MLLGIFLVGILCFEAGFIQGGTKQGESLVISLPNLPSQGVTEKQAVDIKGEPVKTSLSQVQPIVARRETGGCTFVGSKNSNKYHLSSCAVAKRIKPENRVCFTSQEEARERGYLPSCLK